MSKELFSHASVVWPVKDMEASISFYRDQLGFTVNFTWEDPITYAVIRRGEIGIHLTLLDDMPANYKPLTSLFIFVHDVDAVWKEVNDKGVNVVAAIGDRDYGMRDFDITDPDGYRLIFGQGIDR